MSDCRFVSQMARDTAIKRLEHHKSGAYMIRERVAAVGSGDFALSIKLVFVLSHKFPLLYLLGSMLCNFKCCIIL